LLFWRDLNSDPQLNRLYQLSHGIACDAASCAIELERYETAIELLEHGRATIWAKTEQLQADLTHLRSQYPDLAADLERVGKLLSATLAREVDSSADGTHESESSAQLQRRLGGEWEKLVTRTRQLPEFSDFLEPIRFSGLKAAASGGPVAVVNISKYRCDALVLRPQPESIVHVCLDLSLDDANRMREDLAMLLSKAKLLTLSQSPNRRPMDIRRLLGELWTRVSQPIFLALGLQSNSEPSRLWWCLTGPLCFLPIHGAAPPSGPGTRDYVISSYTPTLRSLLRAAVRSQKQPNSDAFELLAVGDPNAQGSRRIPYAAKELDTITTLVSGHSTRFERGDATVKNVLSGLQSCTWAHFACHGVENFANPTRSALQLHDGKLTIMQIAQLNLPKAELAFLSACGTALGHPSHPDESVHLAAAFLSAGFHGIVATMWPVDDHDAFDIAKGVYTSLHESGVAAQAASGLHSAIQQLRAVGVSDLRWLAFVHVGM